MAHSERPRHVALPLATWIEPVDAYDALAAAGHQPQMLDGMGAHPEARWAFVACGTVAHVNVGPEGLRHRSAGGEEWVPPAQALATLRRILKDGLASGHRAGEATERTAAPFIGGWVGVLAYEAARWFEPTLPAVDVDVPDMEFRLCTDVVVFDRREQTVQVHCRSVTDDDRGDPHQRAEALADALRDTAPHDAPGADAPVRAAPQWKTSLDEAAFTQAVTDLQKRIRDGDLFQANIATRFEAPLAATPTALYRGLAAHNPSPFMAILDHGDSVIVSNSPEKLFSVRGAVIDSRPIAGTRRRGHDAADDAEMEAELLRDPKEQAEHTMLVDLVRNDIARVSVPGTVQVAESMSVERYRRVMHLVSRVEATVRPETDLIDWLHALFPGGTITGAPKHRACLRIAEAEPVPRGAYTGSAGTWGWNGDASWNIMIRTAVLRDDGVRIHAGSGIVVGSDPTREWREAGRKAQALLEAASGQAVPAPADDVGSIRRHGRWRPEPPATRVVGRRVLLIDNYDSFVHNLADYCSALGADVRIIRNDEDWAGAVAAFDPTHVILSPGPGRPEDAGASLEMARGFLGRLPVLGVCLGHQCMAVAAGVDVVRAPEVVHGRADRIELAAGRLWGSGALVAARYHSLIAAHDPPVPWTVTARLADGTVMAMEDAGRRVFGLQFHPESMATEGGHEILLRFLQTE